MILDYYEPPMNESQANHSGNPSHGSGALKSAVETMADLFESLPDTVFFAKDLAGRYLAANMSLVERCGLRSKAELLGRSAAELFPSELGVRYARQDQEVMQLGYSVVNRLDLHWYPRRRPGWCLTTKLPLRDGAGNICGLLGISRDLRTLTEDRSITPDLAAALDFLQSNYDQSLTPAALARRAKLPPHRFARIIKRIFHITPVQLITAARLVGASRLLRETDESVAIIAQSCGFCDHSAFTRMFRAATGLTPTEFRKRQAGA